MIILCDVDDVVANLVEPWLARYNKDYDDSVTPDHCVRWEIEEFVKPECGKKIFSYLDSTIYEEVQPMPGALEGVRILRDLGHRVIFVTSCGAETASAKYHWLARHGFVGGTFAQKDLIFATDKSMIRGDVLIDDGLHNCDAFFKHGGDVIVFDRAHNREDRRFMRAHNWEEIPRMIRILDADPVRRAHLRQFAGD